MGYRERLSLFFISDSMIVAIALYLGGFLTHIQFPAGVYLNSVLILLICHHFFSYRFSLYKKAWMYASIGELIVVFKTITLSILLVTILQFALFQYVNIELIIVTWMLHMLLIGGSRFGFRVLNCYHASRNEGVSKKRTLIIGAGSAGTMIVRQLLENKQSELLPVAFIDDNRKKHFLHILGIPVVGDREKIGSIVEKMLIEHIVIAIPSLQAKELHSLVQACLKTGKKTQTIPRIEDLMTGKISVNHFRDVKIEDLLGRETVELDIRKISNYIANKTILITGAGGSIGSEICRQVASFKPKKLILLGHGENSIYTIGMELKEKFAEDPIEIKTEIADIQDGDKMLSIMNQYRPQVVYHAAAHKHVPLMEQHPEEAVKNNLIGTMNVAQAASWSQVETFVMISTDKAVNPTSVMGATKRLAENYIQHLNRESTTKFLAVRFGNVLGSRGSVIPLFKRQIENGGPVTVTHPDMVRYFMTIPEASRLVLQAGALAKGGEIFVLDMGKPVKIVDLAKNLIKLSGYSIEEIGIEFTGIRPGEKLYEELLQPEEVHQEQIYPKIYIGKATAFPIEPIQQLITELPQLERKVLREKLLSMSNGHATGRKVAAL